MKRDVLERPFPEALIRSRKGPFGQTLSYVEGAEFIRRLNEAFEGRWSFAIVQHDIRDEEVIVLGMLTTADGTGKSAFGSSSITVSRDGEIVSIGDDLKAAATDSLKKCSTLLGLGLHLYQSEAAKAAVVAPSRSNGSGNGHPTTGARKGSNGNPRRGNGANGNRLTQKQLSCIWGMARSLGLSADDVRERTTRAFGVQPEFLTKGDASSLIQELGEGLAHPGNGT